MLIAIKSLKPFFDIDFLRKKNLSSIKMSKYSSARYCQKRFFKKKACERYQDLSEKEEEKKHQYGCKRYKNFQEMKNKV